MRARDTCSFSFKNKSLFIIIVWIEVSLDLLSCIWQVSFANLYFFVGRHQNNTLFGLKHAKKPQVVSFSASKICDKTDFTRCMRSYKFFVQITQLSACRAKRDEMSTKYFFGENLGTNGWKENNLIMPGTGKLEKRLKVVGGGKNTGVKIDTV